MTAAADTGYAPRPGTVAHRVLALLEEEAPREFSVAMICERLPGIELHAVKPCLGPAVDHGIVSRRQKADGPRAPFWYRFGRQPANETHAARAAVPGPAPDAAQDDARRLRSSASRACAANLPGHLTALSPSPDASNRHQIRFAMWSDGELHILRERDAEPILLSRDETRALVAYLDSISLEAAT